MIFLKKLLKHPGTWTFLALLSIGVAMAAPVTAPALIIIAGVCMVGAAVGSLFLIKDFISSENKGDRLSSFVTNHPVQFGIVLIGLLLLVAVLVLTIGFFTGGFPFMLPVFAALSAPFTATAVSLGISLCVDALAAITLVFASLNLTNTLKRLAAWFDSFKYDYAASKLPLNKVPVNPAAWDRNKKSIVQNIQAGTNGREKEFYPTLIFKGITETIKNGFSSDDTQFSDEVSEQKPAQMV